MIAFSSGVRARPEEIDRYRDRERERERERERDKEK